MLQLHYRMVTKYFQCHMTRTVYFWPSFYTPHIPFFTLSTHQTSLQSHIIRCTLLLSSLFS